MNYYVTHSDKNFTEVAEKLFDSLTLNSQNKILYYTVNFDYVNTRENVIPIRINSELIANSDPKDISINMLFFKANICCEALLNGDHQYCYVDADCYALFGCDDIFNSRNRIIKHPLLGRNVYNFMTWESRGNCFGINSFDITKCLEMELFNFLGVDINKRSDFYRQSNIILFNHGCAGFLHRWENMSENEIIRADWLKYAPLGDETIINVLLWLEGCDENLEFISTNLPSNVGGKFNSTERIRCFVDAFNLPKEEKYSLYEFCDIPSKTDIGNMKFFHGKTTPDQHKILTDNLLATWKHRVSNTRVDIIKSIGKEFPHGCGVEVGSFKGEFAKKIVEVWGGTLYMVDVWRKLGAEYSDASNQNSTETYHAAIENTAGYEDRCIMIRASSEISSKMFADESLDFVYIDANHAYEFVVEDINLWYPKVRVGGYICGHDYIAIDWSADPNFADERKQNKFIRSNDEYLGLFGVNPAVDEFCKANGYTPRLSEEWLGSWFVQKK